MADNVTLDTNTTSGAVMRSKDRSGVETAIVGIDLGIGTGSETLMSGSMPVNDNSGSLTVDNAGTFAVQAAQSGTWNVTNVSGTVSLPTGAATAAKQPALGTAGTASADVITIQGIASMTAVKVDGSAVTQPVSGTFWQATQPVSGTVTANAGSGTFTVSGTVTANAGTGTFTVQGGAASGASASGNPVQAGGVFNTTQPTVTNGQAVQLQATSRGALIVGTGVDTLHATIDNSTLAVTQSGTWNVGTVTTVTTVSTVTSLSQWAGNAIDTNSGNKSAGTLRVVLATDQPALTNKLLVTPDANSAVNISQMNGVTVTMGNGVSGTGVQRVTIASDSTGVIGATQSGTWTVQPGNTQNSTAWLVTDVPATSGGWTVARIKSASGTNATNVKNAAGQIGGWFLYNNTASAKFVHVYNSSSTPTAGSGTPAFTIGVPANGGTNVEFGKGVAMGAGIGYTITGAITDTDTTSVGADEVHGFLLYR